ncbi:MAG TPA: MFS transporter [Anaerolineae bacterium]|nr:MFS transporter [Anaerolineae bacterium]
MSLPPPIASVLRPALRRLLQLDQPAPALNEAEFAAEVERHYRWNFAVNLMDVASFFFGLSFISASTIVPLFISKLSDSPLLIGLAAVIAQSAWFLPQLFTANRVERLARKKPVAVNLGLFLERVPLWVLVGAAVAATHSAPLALVLFFIAYAWHGLGAGIVATAWQDLIARCFPVERRGRFFGLSMFIGTGMGALSAALSTEILAVFPFPTNFVYTFALAAVFISLSWVFLSLAREPVQLISAPRQSEREFWAQLPDIPRRDHNFRRFLIARLLLALGGMGTGFVTVAAVQRWQVADSTVGVYTAALLLGQTLGNLAFGLLADRLGHKLSLELGAAAACLAFGLAWLAPASEWFFAVFALLGITSGSIVVSGILVVMEFSDPPRRPTYVGMANTGVGLASAAAPLLGAVLAGVDYGLLFASGAIVNLAALGLMRWWVKEPRWVKEIRHS